MQIYPMCQKTDINCGTFAWFTVTPKLSKRAVEIISASWRDGTGKRYKSPINKFVEFRVKRNDPIPVTDQIGITFLTKYNAGVGYISVNFARLALSIMKPVDNVHYGRSTLACTFMKKVFNTVRPALTWYILQLGVRLKFLIALKGNQLYQATTLK